MSGVHTYFNRSVGFLVANYSQVTFIKKLEVLPAVLPVVLPAVLPMALPLLLAAPF